MKRYYGIKPSDNLHDMALAVCKVLGHGSNGKAKDLLLETAAAETQLGTYPDRHAESGHGLHQFDIIGFLDVQCRTRRSDIEKVKQAFKINIEKVKIKDLDNNPLLSFIFCRLKYKLRPEQIPDDIVSRATYWKRYYNTELGKGTLDHYLDSAERHLYPELT